VVAAAAALVVGMQQRQHLATKPQLLVQRPLETAVSNNYFEI
jgi:hypothetical protein